MDACALPPFLFVLGSLGTYYYLSQGCGEDQDWVRRGHRSNHILGYDAAAWSWRGVRDQGASIEPA